jgi:hypothetical protein
MRAIYATNPFVESREVARVIARDGSPGDTIAVLGSEPQIPFYAGVRSVTRCPYVYALVEVHPFAARLQDETIREIETASPEHVVFVRVGTSWLMREHSERRIVDWIASWLREHYDVVGLVEIFSDRPVEYTWGPEAARMKPRAADYLLVLRRKRGSDFASPPR